MPEHRQHKLRAFAVVPAAGESRRMGRDKLLLPWGEAALIDAVLGTWNSVSITSTVVVVHPRNKALVEHCRGKYGSGQNVAIVVPDHPPAEMKHSVRIALDYLLETFELQDDDLWLLAPADLPQLSADVARRVIEHARNHPETIVAPTYRGRRGHPVAFPMGLAAEVASLADNEGVNALLKRHRVESVECGPAARPRDIDTPDDYDEMKDAHTR